MDKNSSYQIQTGEKTIEITPRRWARQANGSAVVKMGETMVLATAVMREEPSEGLGFFPLTVEYEENYWASGKIRGSRFMKRKGRPTDEAVLNGRLVDRSIRPLFPKGLRNEIQIVLTIISYDFKHDPRPLTLIAASAALAVSNIPFEGPVAGTQIGEIDGKLVINPDKEEQAKSPLDLFVAGIGENVSMVEAGAAEVSEEKIIEALALAQQENAKISKLIEKINQDHGQEKITPQLFLPPKAIKESLKEKTAPALKKLFDDYQDKKSYEKAVGTLKTETIDALKEAAAEKEEDFDASLAGDAFEEINKKIIQENILKDQKRLGGRGMDDVRPLDIEVSVVPRPHGSAVFTRGETQGLTTTTLGSPSDELILDGMPDRLDTKQHYMHYYSFPPYSVGECSPMRGPGRREIGHGALGEKALVPVIPSKEKFPYTIIMHTEIMASDGSTSMASVCGSTLALMDAGVPLKRPVSGIAMGLVIDESGKNYQVLTDLCANEDFAGHMDFKVAGTEKGVTALQMDIKVKGLSLEILKDALAKAKAGRAHILEKMLAVIEKPRQEMSPYAPRIEILHIEPSKIGELIGPGGKTINGIIDKTGVAIDIEDDGTVFVTSPDQKAMDEGLRMVKLITKVPKVGEEYIGKVSRLMEFGAFVEFLPNKDGLIHISKLGQGRRIDKVTDVVQIGDKVKVKIQEIDSQGRYNLAFIEKIKD